MYNTGTVSISAGVISIWAVISRNAFAAKLYTRTWLPKVVPYFSFHIVMVVWVSNRIMKSDDAAVAKLMMLAMMLLLYGLVYTYFYKVSR